MEATDEEMTETCTFALSHSKAWMAGATEGTAYWVLPDQVSKMAQAGEFVPKGGIHYPRKEELHLSRPSGASVGEIDYEGERKIMCGPRTALRQVQNIML